MATFDEAQAEQAPAGYDLPWGPTTAPTGPPPANYPTVRGLGQGGICNPNNHHFECRHEKHCYCGLTTRVPQVGDGF